MSRFVENVNSWVMSTHEINRNWAPQILTTPQYPVQYRVPSPSYFQNYIIPSDIIALLERKEQKYTE